MIFVVPHGAPEGYEWLVALVTLVCLYFAVRNFMRARRCRAVFPAATTPSAGPRRPSK
jgi:hypothetical protein